MPAKSSCLIHLFLVVALVSVTHSVNNHVRDHDDTHFFSFSPSPPFGLFSCFVLFFLKPFESNEVFVAFCARSFASQWTLIALKTRKRAISCSSVHILFNSSSAFQRPSGDAIGWMKLVLLWFIFLLSWLFIYFIVKSFMIALTLQVSIRCEEDGSALQRGKIFLCVSSWIKCKLQYFLYFHLVRRGNLYMCMSGRYLLIGHCFLKWLVALKRAVLLVVFG